MSTFWIALGLSLLGGLGGLLIASGVLLIHDSLRARLIPWLVSYAVGALLGISMMGLLPESLNELPAVHVFGTLLGGIMSRPTLFLIDGSSQMYRAYHAFRGRGLSNQEGHTTHAVYVFVTMLRKLIADHKPAYMAVPVVVPRAEHAISRKQIDPDALKVLYRLRQIVGHGNAIGLVVVHDPIAEGRTGEVE